MNTDFQLRKNALLRMRNRLPGKNLYPLARQHGVTIQKNGRLNKGWVGQTIERVAEVDGGNRAGKDGLDFELKSTTLFRRESAWIPKETIKVTNLNPTKILEEAFETSSLWNKLERLIIVGVEHESSERCSVVHIGGVNIEDPDLIHEIRSFWEDVRDLILAEEFAILENLGTSDDYLQLRPTGTSHQYSTCPITQARVPARAFYATKRLIRAVLNIE